MTRPAIRERGAALVSAIFLLVVLAALGAYMLTLSGVEQSTTNRALISVRTYFAARAGLEWGVHQTVSPALGAACFAPATFTPAGSGFDGVSVAVNCSRTLYNNGGALDIYIYVLTSTASHGTAGTTEHAERRLEATVCRADENNINRCGRAN